MPWWGDGGRGRRPTTVGGSLTSRRIHKGFKRYTNPNPISQDYDDFSLSATHAAPRRRLFKA
jgi:hypothetical protein